MLPKLLKCCPETQESLVGCGSFGKCPDMSKVEGICECRVTQNVTA
jgi:hypothetical protein